MLGFYNQPFTFRFGTELVKLLNDQRWQSLEVAVAWVRRSGTSHVLPALVEFLKRGGVFRASVGIDIENTSKEGLSDLLSLCDKGDAEIFVYHNEARGTFHPKVYLFASRDKARLLVGSNNLTEDGLFVNVEAGLDIEAALNDPIVQDTYTALKAWRDPSLGLARPLDNDFLADLVQQGYVHSEETLRKRRQAQRREGSAQQSRVRLFGSVAISAPRPPISEPPDTDQVPTQTAKEDLGEVLPQQTSLEAGRVLLMRARKVSESDRPTQIQIPKQLYLNDPFFEGVDNIASSSDRRSHTIISTSARGNPANTIRVEVPEIRDFDDPVLRLERTPEGIVYQTYDSNSVHGAAIIEKLLEGFDTIPPATQKSHKDRTRATWWRFI